MAENDDGYQVGKGRPPRATQFKPGVSGNPSGRPKKPPTFRADFLAELSAPIDVVENGKRHRLTKQKAMIRSLLAAAIDGDARALPVVLACVKLLGLASDDPKNSDEIEADDLEILKNYLDEQKTETDNPKD